MVQQRRIVPIHPKGWSHFIQGLSDAKQTWPAVRSCCLAVVRCPGTDNTSMSSLADLRQIDYTVVFVRDMAAMRWFYGHVLGFAVLHDLSLAGSPAYCCSPSLR